VLYHKLGKSYKIADLERAHRDHNQEVQKGIAEMGKLDTSPENKAFYKYDWTERLHIPYPAMIWSFLKV
jgi:hypothetical protein